MKKIYLILFCASFFVGNAQINWQRSQAATNYPSWMGTGDTERGMAVLNDKMYVVTRLGNVIKVINAVDGTDLPNVSDYSVVSGGTFILNDVEVSDNGSILACNLTTNASTSTFKIYKWDNESAVPTVYATYTAEALRLGDAFTVVGDISANAVILAAGNGKVVRWIVTAGVLGAPTTITLADTHGGIMVAYPSTISADPDLFVNSNGQSIRKYNADGTSAGETLSIVGGSSNHFKYFILGGREYMAVFQYGAGEIGELATLVDVTGGLGSATTVARTPKLGPNTNGNGAGDVAFTTELDLVDGINNTINVFALGTNNGISGTALVFEGTVLSNKKLSVLESKIFPNPASNQFQITLQNTIEKNAEVIIYDIHGRQVKSSKLASKIQSISIGDLSRGLYLVNIKNGANQSTTKLLKN
jgi:trimeric autotransporter adhesin